MAQMSAAPAAETGRHWLDVPKVVPGSEEHADLLAVGYGMTVAEAEEIVETRKKNPNAFSLPELRKAQALLAAHAAQPVVTAKRQMWKRPLAG